MYPLRVGFDYPRNQWYVAGWSHEFGDGLLARRILGTPLVLYRTEDGRPVALDDRCPHRRFQLSMSQRQGDNIQCGYHGFTYDPHGRCVSIPSQSSVPSSYAVRSFPVVERWQWVWIWMGDPALADEALIPDHAPLHVLEEGWKGVIGGLEHVDSRYVFLQDNLLDLTHVSFLHGDTIGSPGVATTEPQVQTQERFMEIARYIKGDNMDHLPLAKALGVKGAVDRDMVQQFYPPSMHCTGSYFRSSLDGQPYGGFRVIHGLTPETETSTHYFWGFCRNFGLEDEALTQRMRAVLYAALEQDIVGVQSSERMVRLEDPGPEIHARADGPALRGRKLIEQQVEDERARADA